MIQLQVCQRPTLTVVTDPSVTIVTITVTHPLRMDLTVDLTTIIHLLFVRGNRMDGTRTDSTASSTGTAAVVTVSTIYVTMDFTTRLTRSSVITLNGSIARVAPSVIIVMLTVITRLDRTTHVDDIFLYCTILWYSVLYTTVLCCPYCTVMQYTSVDCTLLY